MFKFFDNGMEYILLKRLEKNRKPMLYEVLLAFKKRHPDVSREDFVELCEKLVIEHDRVYYIVNKSLLKAGIIRAKYVCLGVMLISFINLSAQSNFSFNDIKLYISPLVSALATMIISLATIEIGYEQRVKAAYASVLSGFERTKYGQGQTGYSALLESTQALFEESKEESLSRTSI